MIKVKVQAEISGRVEEWILHASIAEPWTVRAVAPDGRRFEAGGFDLFRALQSVRTQLEAIGIRLCCNGARPEARPSPQASGEGAGMIYLLPRWRKPALADIVPLLAPASPASVGTVADQELFWDQYRSASWLAFARLLNPINWLQCGFWPGQVWISEERDGFTVWKQLRFFRRNRWRGSFQYEREE